METSKIKYYTELVGKIHELNKEIYSIKYEIGFNQFNKSFLYIQPSIFVTDKYINIKEKEYIKSLDFTNLKRHLFVDGDLFNGTVINNIKVNQKIYKILNNNFHYIILNYVVKHLKPYANCIVFSYKDIINEYKLDKNIYTEEEYDKTIDIFVNNEIFGIIISESKFKNYIGDNNETEKIKIDIIDKTVYVINTDYICSINELFIKSIILDYMGDKIKDITLIFKVTDDYYNDIIDPSKIYKEIDDKDKELKLKLKQTEERYARLRKELKIVSEEINKETKK